MQNNPGQIMRFYDGIDWPQAWFTTVRPQAASLIAAADWRTHLNTQAAQAQMRNHRGLPLQFIAQEALPEGVAYEAHISATGLVPTRENLHDFFNALVWLTFPKIKRQLNALQSAQIATLGIGKSRGPARDAATIFDENAALLVVEDSVAGRSLLENLRQHQWQAAFIGQAALFGSQAEVWSFGHALMDKLVKPYKAITAHTWVVWADAEFFTLEWNARRAWLDTQVAEKLCTHDLTTADYTPLPVLGIPGWWPEQDAAFYADTGVFRAKRCK
ncbi:MAG: DUF3025 domain-containing protein [Undibacterium sp.]|nr:DUF3025 domain-containing protein [Undibacterium sp.]MDO8651144.1 DUF3025 domain-containing protein [Undibacterium sp.]